MSDLTHARLLEIMDYDAQAGIFTWKISPGPRTPIGSRVGHRGPQGRSVVVIDGTLYYLARLAWLYVKGAWPVGVIVQEGGIKAEVPFAELVEKSHSELRADGGPNSLNKSGVKGVSWSKTAGRWVAMITRDGRQHYLGKFITKEEAAEAYRHAAETGELRGKGSAKDPNWAKSRRQRTAKWADIQFDPRIVGWETLEEFLADVGPPPTAEHVLYRERYEREPFGPGNAMWRLPWSKRAGHEEDPQRSYNHGLKHPNSDPDQWRRLFVEQDGRCAICRQPETIAIKGESEPRRIAQDHDHETGIDRGLLCGNCNNGIGRFNDNPARLRAAAEYIEHHRALAATTNVVPLKKDAC